MRPRHALFVKAYLKDYNASQAYRDAGYHSKNADVCGPKLLGTIGIQAELARIRASQLKTLEVTKDRVLEEIARLAYVDPSKLFDEHGKLKPVPALDENTRRAIASMKILRTNLVSGDGQREETHEVKLWDKPKALEMLAKHLGLYSDSAQGPVQIVVSWQQTEKPNTLAIEEKPSTIDIEAKEVKDE